MTAVNIQAALKPFPCNQIVTTRSSVFVLSTHRFVDVNAAYTRQVFLSHCLKERQPLLFCSVQGWYEAKKPVLEILSLERLVKGSNVPLPKALIKAILTAVLPRVLQRKLLASLPPELGQYLIDAGRGFAIAGELWLNATYVHILPPLCTPWLFTD